MVSVDVPWSPFDIDGRNYDWPALTAAADLLFVMAYDTQAGVLDTEDSVTEVMWDELGSASTFTYFNKQDNLPHQVWFDTPQSLLPHYQLARRLGLRGVGCWNLEMLYSTDPGADKPDARAAMWQAVEDGFFA
ncbi:di-N-acetylchitobiase [Haematococcus lacustris]|uniref:Di-N-acetylchitobiase n=1 Tax=Haematococcus lacustris TaxID=44745 RepID=A0A699ZCT2_HAELA|nr:di-N-acetylchitobiase [Haematococcus lacustris]